MKKTLAYFLIGIIYCGTIFAQETTEKTGDNPVLSPFEHGWLIDDQTGVVPEKGLLEMVIQHRFGMINNGISDLFGIYSPGANIRLALNYTFFKNVQFGYGLTKNNMVSDFSVKWTVFEQTLSGSKPVSLTLFGNMAVDGRNKDQLGIYYDFLNRLSYYSEIIVGRKFTDWLTVQVHGSFIHYNIVATDLDHDRIGAGISGRVKVSSMSSLFFQYDTPVNLSSMTKNTPVSSLPNPNLGLGYEISTGYHSFQIYLTTSSGILPQENYMFNRNDFTGGEMMLGFTITRLFGL